MATYVLVPGGGGDAWSWHLVVPRLERLGHEVVAIDLPAPDPAAGLQTYADVLVEAIGDRTDLVVVAHSLGGFSAPLVCERLPTRMLVLLNAMVPEPGERAEDWWDAVGLNAARRAVAERDGRSLDDEDFERDAFFHDVPDEITAVGLAEGQDQSNAPMVEPWRLAAWPDVPTRVLIGRDDRFMPVELQRKVAADRLGIAADEMPGGHMVMLSQPDELVARLEAYRLALG